MSNTLRLLAVTLIGVVLPGASFSASRVFYDGFESRDTGQWQKDDYRNRCSVVTRAADAVTGPYRGQSMASCNWNGTVAWNSPPAFETLRLPSMASSDEVFYRIRVRLDKDVMRSEGSPAKLLRIYVPGAATNDVYAGACTNKGLCNAAVVGGTQLTTYWGSKVGDVTNDSSAWHEVEYYFRKSTGSVKIWHDGVLVRNQSGLPLGGTSVTELYLLSNFADPHDAENHAYFDDIEVYTEAGVGATGSMSDGSIVVGSDPQPQAPRNVMIE